MNKGDTVKDQSSKYIGVYWCSQMNKWKATIIIKKRAIHLGYFVIEEDAARAFDEYVLSHGLVNKKINFPIEPEITIPNTRWIYLTQMKWALVDSWNYERLNANKWQAHKYKNGWYATRTMMRDGKWMTELMQREVLGVTDRKIHVDHKNRVTLDYREDNLRKGTRVQNLMNKVWCNDNSKKSSKYKGVSYHKRNKKWTAYISFENQLIYLGSFIDEESAAREYDRNAIKYYGEFAHLNFPEDYLGTYQYVLSM